MNHTFDMNGRKRSYEVHALDQTSNAYHGNMPAPSAPFQWQDMEYTPSTMEAPRFAPTSAPIQYTANGLMSFSPVDYTQHDFPYAAQYSDDNHASVHTSNLYRVGPFRFTELANIDGDAASVSQESIYSRSTRIHSLTDSERRDSQPNSILSSNDARRESEPYDRIFPMTPIDSESIPTDVPRSEPPLNMANLARIEECARVPGSIASPHFMVPAPPSKRKGSNDQSSPAHAIHSTLTSPTSATFQESATTDASTLQKPRRMPRSKSANASLGDSTALEKASKLRARQAHSLVERKYRDNLNLKITQLHQTLQNARYGSWCASRSPSKELRFEYFDEDTIVSPDMPNEKSSTGSTPTGPKVRKSDVLTEAMNYVNAAEVEMRHMSEELMRLTAELETVKRQPRCGECRLLKQMDTLQVEGQQAGPKQ